MNARLLQWSRLILATAGMLAVAFQILVVHFAAGVVGAGNETLVRLLGGKSADAQTLIAMHRLKGGNLEGAITASVDALRLAPGQQRAVPILATAQAIQGKRLLAVQLMDLAARSGWRDPFIQWWVFNLGVQTRNFDVAAQRADALLRQQQLEPHVFGALMRLEMTEGREAIAKRLVENPPWRPGFLTRVAGLTPAQLLNRAGLLLEIDKRGGVLNETEIAATVNALTAASHAREARTLWVKLAGRSARVAAVWDGSFDHVARRERSTVLVPFEWRLFDLLEADIEIATPSDGSQGSALHVTADAGAAGSVLQQSLTLTPAKYVMTFAFDAKGGTFPARWSITCSDGRKLEPNQVRHTQGTWTRATYTLSVASGCELQRLRLDLTAESAERSEFWLDDLSIERQAEQ